MEMVLNIVNIRGIPLVGDRNAVFVVDCPDYLGYSSVRIEKTWV